jgi:glycerol-3-phosphate dehydrogenase
MKGLQYTEFDVLVISGGIAGAGIGNETNSGL